MNGRIQNMANHARTGYGEGGRMARILKRKNFARWQAGEDLPDAALCKAVKEMDRGLIDADSGGFLYKKRVARPDRASPSPRQSTLSKQADETGCRSGSKHDLDTARRDVAAQRRADHDLHITAQAGQTIEHLGFADPPELAAQHF